MKRLKNILFWILAVLLTLGMARYQRKTGPTYPVDGTVAIGDQEITYHLTRSHGGEGDHTVTFTLPEGYEAVLAWKRYPLDEPYQMVQMQPDGEGNVTAPLPHQPPAGKLAYHLMVRPNPISNWTPIPEHEDVIIRFKGSVPGGVLAPHILLMFIAMLLSTRAAIAAIAGERVRPIAIIAFICLLIGGLFLGPVVQKFAFGEYWTGWPFGEDYTDNKTAAAVIAWAVALWFLRGPQGEKRGRWWSFGAAMVLLVVYMIPHSLGGSTFNYETGEIATGGNPVEVQATTGTQVVISGAEEEQDGASEERE